MIIRVIATIAPGANGAYGTAAVPGGQQGVIFPTQSQMLVLANTVNEYRLYFTDTGYFVYQFGKQNFGKIPEYVNSIEKIDASVGYALDQFFQGPWTPMFKNQSTATQLYITAQRNLYDVSVPLEYFDKTGFWSVGTGSYLLPGIFNNSFNQLSLVEYFFPIETSSWTLLAKDLIYTTPFGSTPLAFSDEYTRISDQSVKMFADYDASYQIGNLTTRENVNFDWNSTSESI